MFGKLLTWLFRRLFGLRYHYFELRDGKYLKVKRGTAEIVDLEDVPDTYRIDHGEASDLYVAALENVSLARKLAPSTRLSVLEDLPPFAVLEKAQQNSLVEHDVLENPSLVDADSTFEAQLKLDLVDGKDITRRLETNEDVSESDVEEMLDTDFLAKWGYNKYGEKLPEKLRPSASEDEGDRESGGDDASAATAHTSEKRSGTTSSSTDRRHRVPRATDTSARTDATGGGGRQHRVPRAEKSSQLGNSAASGNRATKEKRTTKTGNAAASGNTAVRGNSATGGDRG